MKTVTPKNPKEWDELYKPHKTRYLGPLHELCAILLIIITSIKPQWLEKGAREGERRKKRKETIALCYCSKGKHFAPTIK